MAVFPCKENANDLSEKATPERAPTLAHLPRSSSFSTSFFRLPPLFLFILLDSLKFIHALAASLIVPIPLPYPQLECRMGPSTHDSPPNQGLNNAIFVVLIVGGHVCFPFMLLCMFISRKSLSRSLLFLHFCLTWVLHSVGFSILFYSGKFTGPEPAFGPCIIQAVLVHVAPVIESSFLCALCYHLRSTLEVALKSKSETSELSIMALITGSYLVALVPAFIVCVVAMNRPEFLYRGDSFFCSIWFRPVNYIDSAIIGILLSTSVFLEYRIALLLYKNRLVLKQVTVQGFALLQLFIRLSLFMLVTVACVAMVVSAFVYRMNKFRVVVQAALPVLAFLIFGTCPRFYCLTHRKEKPVEDEHPPPQWKPQTAEAI